MSKPLLFSWIAAIIAFLGSLYFSEVMGFIPCTLCWYQRILMYPLVLLLGVAVYRDDRQVYRYALPFALLGVIVSGYHYSLQKFNFVQKWEVCAVGVPCSSYYVNWLGFITIPFLAFIAFIGITVMLILLKNDGRKTKKDR